MSRAARARAAAIRVQGVGCGSCSGDVGQFPQYVGDWPTCRACWGDEYLVGHRTTPAVQGLQTDAGNGDLRVAELHPARTASWFETSRLHRAARALGVELSHDLRVVAEQHQGPLAYFAVDGAAPGDPAGGKPWHFVGKELRQAYDERRARREQTVARFPDNGCCRLCGVNQVPRNPNANGATDPDALFEHMIAAIDDKHYCGACANDLDEARNLTRNSREAVAMALGWRLSAHVGSAVNPAAWGIETPRKGDPGTPEPFGHIDIQALRGHLKAEQSKAVKVTPNVLRSMTA